MGRTANKSAVFVDAIKGKVPEARNYAIAKGGKLAYATETKIKIRTMPVCWGIPMDEVMYSLWFSNFMHQSIMPWDDIAITMSTYLMEARNFIHSTFVEKMHAPYLVMLDSDVMPPPDFVDRLLVHKKDIVGGWYKIKNGRGEPVVYDRVPGVPGDHKGAWKQRTQPGTGLEKVGAAGAGCWLITRKAAETLGTFPYTRNQGEDLEFCELAQKKGIDLWIDWNIACAHAGVGVT